MHQKSEGKGSIFLFFFLAMARSVLMIRGKPTTRQTGRWAGRQILFFLLAISARPLKFEVFFLFIFDLFVPCSLRTLVCRGSWYSSYGSLCQVGFARVYVSAMHISGYISLSTCVWWLQRRKNYLRTKGPRQWTPCLQSRVVLKSCATL